jgi:3-oxoacyl-[acyl-carrier protein] reductase
MPHVLVTGASGGIGAAICRALAQRGVTLTLHYQADRESAEATRRALAGEGHALIQGDVGDATAVERLWQEVDGRRPVDALVNNAGIFPSHPPLTTDYGAWVAAWQRTLSVNLIGPAHLSYCAARAMAARRGGRVVSVSSRSAFRGEPSSPAYAASKAGLNAVSQSLAKVFAARGVYFYVVAPGWVSTARVADAIRDPAVLADHPLGRVTTPEEVAQVISWCALDAPPAMTGAVLDVNGASYLR